MFTHYLTQSKHFILTIRNCGIVIPVMFEGDFDVNSKHCDNNKIINNRRNFGIQSKTLKW